MQLLIPGSDAPLIIESLILDLNGTLAIDGKLIDGVSERLILLKQKGLNLFLFTGDTYGTAAEIADVLGLEVRITKSAEEKAREAQTLHPDTCVAIGNGKIDEQLFKTVRLGIAVVQAEGLHVDALLAADLVVPTINDALDLLAHEKRLVATLRR